MNMIINHLILFEIVLSFMIFGHAEIVTADDFTGDQYVGLWYDIGKISIHNDSSNVESCNLHEVIRNNNNRTFYHMHIKLHNIITCEHGIPVYTYTTPEEIENSTIISVGNTEELSFASSVKSYNNGKEVILSDKKNESSAVISYRLWSRERQVSEETKAEFEKLIENGTITYYFWEHCPKLSSETGNKFPLKQLAGNWHSVSDIAYGSVIDNGANVQSRILVDDETQTLVMITTSHGFEFYQGGKIVGYMLHMKSNDDMFEDSNFRVMSCNKGMELILCQERTQNCGLWSRHEVSSVTRLGFEQIAKVF